MILLHYEFLQLILVLKMNHLKYNAKIIHIASHSEVYPNDKLFSVIYLNDDYGNTGNTSGSVFAHELFNLDLNNELIILSSCKSGAGTLVQGSGIIGLGRALTYAGSRSLVMNTWSIRDKTASELTISFLEYLNEGKPRDFALRLAKIQYLNERDSNPAVWGSLILYGKTDSIRTRNTDRIYFFSLLLLLIVGFLLFYSRRYRR